ncbi:MAG: hypothetical protein R3C11_05565 [Planctomycetaceae bacterium]
MKPHRLLSVAEIISRIESIAIDLEVHGETHQTGVSQTSFSYSEHPGAWCSPQIKAGLNVPVTTMLSP